MSKTYKEWLDYYSNATKEQVIEELTIDNQEIERLKSIISSTKEDFLNANSKNIELEDKLQQRENIIKEVRRHIDQDIKSNYFKRYDDEVYKLCDDILEILDKVEVINER